MHAREWIGPPTVMYIVEELLKGYKVDTNVTDILDNFSIYAMPVVNPDGYEYSRTTVSGKTEYAFDIMTCSIHRKNRTAPLI